RPKWRNLFLFRAVARDYSFCVYIVTKRNSERCLHFGRHDRSTQRSNISHLVTNEVEAFAGERGSLAVPRKPLLLNVSGQALRSPARLVRGLTERRRARCVAHKEVPLSTRFLGPRTLF